MYAKPFVVAVVLNYRYADDTLRCVQSLAASTYHRLSIVVVDNGSPTKTVTALTDRLDPAITTILSSENLGYAGGNNLGIHLALERSADYVWLVNPDVVVEPFALQRIVDALRGRPQAGIMGSRILYGGSSPPKIWFNGGTIDRTTGAASHMDMGSLDSAVPEGRPFSVDYVTGAAMLVRCAVFGDVGLLPEDYFLYYEETEFNVTAALSGWSVFVQPTSRAWHYQRSTGSVPAPYYIYYYVRNRLVFGKRVLGLTSSSIIAGLDGFIAGWRSKVARHAPEWVQVYDELVARAVMHGTNGMTGRWHELDRIPGP